MNGPLHTNDSILVCGSPNFGERRQRPIELNQDDPGLGGLRQRRLARLHRHARLPRRHPADAAVERRAGGAADAGYVFSGETTIVFNGNTMNVTNGGTHGLEAAAPRAAWST